MSCVAQRGGTAKEWKHANVMPFLLPHSHPRRLVWLYYSLIMHISHKCLRIMRLIVLTNWSLSPLCVCVCLPPVWLGGCRAPPSPQHKPGMHLRDLLRNVHSQADQPERKNYDIKFCVCSRATAIWHTNGRKKNQWDHIFQETMRKCTILPSVWSQNRRGCLVCPNPHFKVPFSTSPSALAG